MGDLNYRMDRTKSAMEGIEMSILTNVSLAATIEKECLGGDDNWLSRRYNLLRSPHDPEFPSHKERILLHRAQDRSKEAWETVLKVDELRLIMKYGDAFCGFEEVKDKCCACPSLALIPCFDAAIAQFSPKLQTEERISSWGLWRLH